VNAQEIAKLKVLSKPRECVKMAIEAFVVLVANNVK